MRTGNLENQTLYTSISKVRWDSGLWRLCIEVYTISEPRNEDSTRTTLSVTYYTSVNEPLVEGMDIPRKIITTPPKKLFPRKRRVKTTE